MIKIQATSVLGRDLKPGDLFSTVGPEYWDLVDRLESIGERVYIRMNTPFSNAPDSNEEVFRIEIIQEG